LEQDSCVSGAKRIFLRHGARSLIIAKFVPGFSTFAQPLAGAMRMSWARFLAFDAVGAFVWTATFAGLGYFFSDQIERIIAYATDFGWWFGAAMLAALLAFVAWKFIERQRLIRSLRVARIAPSELKQKLDAGESVLIVDLRDRLDFDANPHQIPTAVRFAPDELEARHLELPRDRDLILYCTCPNEATSARAALRLHRRGITRVRPLYGGLQSWSDLDFPLESIEVRETV
jgi:rhodanese-related sulfurtransferase